MGLKEEANIKVANWFGDGFRKHIASPLVDYGASIFRGSNVGKNLTNDVASRALALEKLVASSVGDAGEAIRDEIARGARQIGQEAQVGQLSAGMLSGMGGLAGGIATGGIAGMLGPVINSKFNPGINFKNLPPEMQEKLTLLVKRSL